MYNQERAIDRLREAIETECGRKMRTPKDYDFLAEAIFEKLHQSISPTTLKRLWGYLSESSTPRTSTLDILAQFVNYANWQTFCQQTATLAGEEGEAEVIHEEENDTTALPEQTASKSRALFPTQTIVIFLLLAVIATMLFVYFKKPSQPANDNLTLTIGHKFKTYSEYLSLFGIHDTATYWGKVLPHHPNVVVWGPEYQHPCWHNYGNRDSMMPTITERWEPANTDSTIIAMRNRDKYYHELRLNEVRITFMKNLVDTGYVFLGIYRLSTEKSDTSKCVWERVSDVCDLNHLDYLEELRN